MEFIRDKCIILIVIISRYVVRVILLSGFIILFKVVEFSIRKYHTIKKCYNN
jgi:hypothetical protein